jgi:hypothetical protein
MSPCLHTCYYYSCWRPGRHCMQQELASWQGWATRFATHATAMLASATCAAKATTTPATTAPGRWALSRGARKLANMYIPVFGMYPPGHNQCVHTQKVECRNGAVSAGRRFSMFPSAPAEASTQSGGARTWANMSGTRTSTDLPDTQCASQRKRAQPHMPNAHRTKLPKRKHTHNHTQTKTQYHHHRNHHQHTTTQHNTTQHNTTQQNTTQPNTTHNTTQPNTTHNPTHTAHYTNQGHHGHYHCHYRYHCHRHHQYCCHCSWGCRHYH